MKKISFVAGLCAALIGMGGAVRGDVAYTTYTSSGLASNTNQGNASSNLINNGIGLTGDTNGFRVGTFGGGTNFTLAGQTALVRFTTGSSGLVLNGIGVNLFMDDAGAPVTAGTLTQGTVTWSLYNGASQNSLVTSFTQIVTNISHDVTGTSDNAYFSAISANTTLTANTQYTLALTGFTVQSQTGNLNGDDLHWTFTKGSTPAGGRYTVDSAGFVTGTYSSNAQGVTGANIAFDIQAVPEPGTMALGAIASLAGAGGWWSRRKKKVAELTEEVVA